jgi:hypothetical protein
MEGEQHAASDYFVTLGEPLHNNITSHSAYVVVPATMTFKVRGSESGVPDPTCTPGAVSPDDRYFRVLGAPSLVSVSRAEVSSFPNLKLCRIDCRCTGHEAKPTDGLDCHIAVDAIEELSKKRSRLGHDSTSATVTTP